MNESIVVYGPQGCGKTTAAQALATHFGLHTIVDDESLPPKHVIRATPGCLYLTNDRPEWAPGGTRWIYSFRDAAAIAGIKVRPSTNPTDSR